MNAFEQRLSKLEKRSGLKTQPIWLIIGDGAKRGLDEDACIQVLVESGFLAAGGGGIVNLHEIPAGLNTEETARFIRENGATICGSPLPYIAKPR